MICKKRGDGWEVIFQRNHALLAAEILADWKPEHRPQPWIQLLNACAQHDHGWQENDKDYLLSERGEPLDFLHIPMQTTLVLARRNLLNADAQSRWCAILVARHGEYLYSFKDDPDSQSYVRELKEFRTSRMADIDVSAHHVEKMYELLCWADSLSLLVCCDPSDFTRSLELKAQGREYHAEQVREDLWSLHPWPYQSQTVELDYEVRVLPQPSFASPQELREALYQSPVTLRRLELRPAE
jgi:hypothetical protein